MKKIIAFAATALVLGATVVGSQLAFAASTPAQRCSALEQQFDKAAPGHKMVKNYTEATKLRADGGTACAQHKETDGVKKLEDALGILGVKPAKS